MFRFGALWSYGHAFLGNDVSKFSVWRTAFHFGALWSNGQPYNVRVRVSLLPEIGKTPILADFYVVSIFLNSVAIRMYFSASVTGT